MAVYRQAALQQELSLSECEQAVLVLLARGLPNVEIAAALTVSENTVRFHLKNIYEKLHVTNRTRP